MVLLSRRTAGGILVAVGVVLVVAHAWTTGGEHAGVFLATTGLAVVVALAGVAMARGRLVSEGFAGRAVAWLAAGTLAFPVAVFWVDPGAVGDPFASAVLVDAVTLGALAGLLVGLYDARNRKHQRDLDRLHRITNALRVATQEVVHAADRDELEQAVCDRLATSDPYESVWVGRYDPDEGVVRPSAWAGLPDDYYESLTVTVDETPKGKGAGGRAIRTRETQAVPDVFADETMKPWWDLLRTHGVESLAVVPIYHEDTVYGFYSIYADRPEVFDETERDVLTELGETLGNAIAAIETRERLARRERELEQQNRRLEEFASVVSHDLRNPLNVAEGYIDLARETADEDVRDTLSHVDAALDRMRELIEDVLALARHGTTVRDPEPVSLDAVVEDAWLIVDTENATLTTGDLGRVRADRSRLQQLLENLFRNSVEHGGPDVTVTVGALPDEPGFYVADDGPGLSAGDREQAFEMGYSSSADGTGFGLNIVRTIAEAHGWQVTLAESEAGGVRVEFSRVETVES